MYRITVQSELIGAELRRYREQAGMQGQHAGMLIGASPSKICNVEAGRQMPQVEDVAGLLTLYRVVGPARADLLRRTREAAKPGLWQPPSTPYERALQTISTYESRATSIGTYQSELIPGLLQTRPYIEAVMREIGELTDLQEIDNRVTSRLARQCVLSGPDAPSYTAIINEIALRNPVGGPAVMRAQLGYLIEMAAWTNITIRVLPRLRHGHPGMQGSFVRFRIGQHRNIVYVPGDIYLEETPDIADYHRREERLLALALGEEDSLRRMTELANDFDAEAGDDEWPPVT
ncbi:helix-turn-helix domain-containing protein [Solihabitans fulvus]|nr:helix-turn-helix transcriptional regulator [Solihabitans fulvus]